MIQVIIVILFVLAIFVGGCAYWNNKVVRKGYSGEPFGVGAP